MSNDNQHSTGANRTATPLTATQFQPLQGGGGVQRAPISRRWIALGVLMVLAVAAMLFLFVARAVVFKVDPFEAEVEVKSLFSFNIGSNYLLLQGRHRVVAQADGYRPLDTFVDVSNIKNQQIPLVLEPLPGVIEVTGTPEEISVSLGETQIGTVPGRVEEIPLGEQTLTFTKHRYLPQSKTLEIIGRGQVQSLDIALLPAWGQLTLTTDPAGAEVSVDGEIRGTTPLQTEILQTGSEVTIALPDYQRWQQRLTVTAGSSEAFPLITLAKAPGRLALQSTPAGASVTVDGQYRGATPVEISLSPDQPHQLQFFLQGYTKANRTVTVKPNEQQQLAVNLPPQLGDIQLNVSPADAEVLIDGVARDIGSGGKISLPAKPHRLEVRKSGYVAQQQSFTPRPGIAQSLTVKLLTEQQARWAKVPGKITSPAGATLVLMRPDHTFTMGAPRRDPGRRANETERKVRLDKPFYLGIHEITNQQFRLFDANHNSRQFSGITLDLPNQPVVNVSWIEAAKFCNWLSQQERLPLYYQIDGDTLVGVNHDSSGYRLPTEVEWAWAARMKGDELLKYPWGDSYPPTEAHENYADRSAQRFFSASLTYNDKATTSAEVGSYQANSRGLFDMGGNVAEWISDYYDVGNPNRGEAELNPTGPAAGTQFVVRGASWKMSSRSELRLSYRDFGRAGREDIGFRVARNLE